jgi:K+-transporting ATPase ATPase C chain
VTGDPTHGAYVDEWTKKHAPVVADFIKANPATPQPKAPDLAIVFFETYSKENPGTFPSAVTRTGKDGKPVTSIAPVKAGSDIQTIFFDM